VVYGKAKCASLYSFVKCFGGQLGNLLKQKLFTKMAHATNKGLGVIGAGR